MAETNENGNGASAGAPAGAAPAAPQPGQAPASLTILAQYVKDLSFENPDAPNSLRPRQTAPRINININVQSNQLTGAAVLPGGAQGSDYEVELKMEARAVDGDKALFAIELAYAGIFRITNVPAEQIRAVMLIEGPRLLFPFARQILAEASRNGGFPPLMVDPVDFSALYRQRMAQAQAAAGAAPQRLV